MAIKLLIFSGKGKKDRRKQIAKQGGYKIVGELRQKDQLIDG